MRYFKLDCLATPQATRVIPSIVELLEASRLSGFCQHHALLYFCCPEEEYLSVLEELYYETFVDDTSMTEEEKKEYL